MKTKELIEALSSMPQDADVAFWYDGSIMKACHCYLAKSGDVMITQDSPYFYAEMDSCNGWEYKTNACRWEPA